MASPPLPPLRRAVSLFWQELRRLANGNANEVARWVRRAAAEDYGWLPPRRRSTGREPSPNGTNVERWISNGSFDNRSEIRQASVDVMRDKVPVPPEGVPESWHDPGELLLAFCRAEGGRQAVEAEPKVRPGTGRLMALDKLLDGESDLSVREATLGEHMRRGFLQGSWLTDDEVPPYVPRAVDERLHRLIGGGCAVVLGPPKSGKTRTLLEAIRLLAPDKKLWRLPPQAPDALETVWQAVSENGGRPAEFPPQGVILLLDDLQRHDFSTGTGVSYGQLVRLIQRGVTVVATMHADQFRRLANYQHDKARSADDIELGFGASQSLVDLLERHSIELAPELTPSELERVDADIVSQAAVKEIDQARFVRLPELLAAVDALAARAAAGRVDAVHPERGAVIEAAIDANVVHPQGATYEELSRLMQWAFRRLTPTKIWRDARVEEALDWATDPIGGAGSVHAVVHGGDGDRLRLYDPLLPRLLPGMWNPEHLTDRMAEVPPIAQARVGYWCMTHDLPGAVPWLEAAAVGGISAAMNNLAIVLERQGDARKARDWFERAAEAGDRNARYTVGMRAFHRSDYDQAWELLRRNSRPEAQVYLGVIAAEGLGSPTLLREENAREQLPAAPIEGPPLERVMDGAGERTQQARQADERRARGFFFRAFRIPTSFPLVAELSHQYGPIPLATVMLHREVADCHRWQDQGNAFEAKLAYACLLQREGSYDDAATWFERCMDSDEPRFLDRLGRHLLRFGEQARAEMALRRAERAGSVEALNDLGRICQARGDWKGAESWYRKGAEAGVLAAQRNLGLVLRLDGPRLEEAEHWALIAVEGGSVEALEDLGVIHQEREESEQAERWFRRAAERGLASAQHKVGLLCASRDQLAEAERWYLKAAGKANRDAMNNLGNICHARNDLAGAERWYREGALGGSGIAMHNLASLLVERGDLDEARRWYKESVAVGYHHSNTHIASEMLAQGDVDGAVAILRDNVDRGDGEACLLLGLVEFQADRFGKAEELLATALALGVRGARVGLCLILANEGEWAMASDVIRGASNEELEAELARIKAFNGTEVGYPLLLIYVMHESWREAEDLLHSGRVDREVGLSMIEELCDEIGVEPPAWIGATPPPT